MTPTPRNLPELVAGVPAVKLGPTGSDSPVPVHAATPVVSPPVAGVGVMSGNRIASEVLNFGPPVDVPRPVQVARPSGRRLPRRREVGKPAPVICAVKGKDPGAVPPGHLKEGGVCSAEAGQTERR